MNYPIAFLLLWLLHPHLILAQIFVPPECRSTCGDIAYNIAESADDFLSIDPRPGQLTVFTTSRASTWGVALLRLVKEAVRSPGPPRQNVTITPPAVARLLGGYSMAVYQAFAVWSEYLYAYGRYFQPLSSDMVNLRDPSQAAAWDALTEPYGDAFPGNYAPADEAASAAQMAAISGAANKFLNLFFCNDRKTQPLWCAAADNITASAMAFVGYRDRADYPVPFKQGEDIAVMVFDQLSMINLLRDTNATLARERLDLAAIPPSQPTAAVHQCDNLHKGAWYWQRLTVPRTNRSFVPSGNPNLSPFPPDNYTALPAASLNVPFFRGFAATLAGPALKSTQEARPMVLAGLNGPPGEADAPGLRKAMREVLQQSGTLDDRKKVIAEFWADGPESTTPPGHWYKIAIEESNSNSYFAIKGLNPVDRTIWATLLVGLSLHEAGLLAWELKVKYMGARPITGIQCLLGPTANGRRASAWRGPYLGIGPRNLSNWQPYQPTTFITPPFSGYVSGHATFSAAAAEALRQTRSSFNTTFVRPEYNCYKTPKGYSSIEPWIPANQPGYVRGVTDRPNRGPKSLGYAPAKDVVMCWEKYEDAAQQAAMSRIYGGIHIGIDNEHGLTLGKKLGETVAASLARLSPVNYMVKAEIFNRPEPLGKFNNLNSAIEDLVCPPGTFLRSWDGSYDASGLYALGLTCSDGTFIGSLGVWGFGTEVFAESTENDGYTSVTAALDDNTGCVVAVSFTDRQNVTGNTYGPLGRPTVTTSCRDDERIVGLTARSGPAGNNIGAFGLLCGKVKVEDVTERSVMVPANPDSGAWRYDYQCPEGTYITRFFGRAGRVVNTLTAQCSRVWNLKVVGLPADAQPSDAAYTYTSLDGFTGIIVKSYSGSLDSISFVNASGATPVVGNPAVPGDAVTLSCNQESRMIGIFGWEDTYVSSIGIICSMGEFAPVATTVRELRKLRNPEPKLRIPGGGVIAASVSEVVPLTMPRRRIATRVTVSSRARRAWASSGANMTGSMTAQQGSQVATAERWPGINVAHQEPAFLRVADSTSTNMQPQP